MSAIVRDVFSSVCARQWMQVALKWDNDFSSALYNTTKENADVLCAPMVVNTTVVVNINESLNRDLVRLSRKTTCSPRELLGLHIPGSRGMRKTGSFMDAHCNSVVKLSTHMRQLTIPVKDSFSVAVVSAITFAARVCCTIARLQKRLRVRIGNHAIAKRMDMYFSNMKLVSFSASTRVLSGVWFSNDTSLMKREHHAVVFGFRALIEGALCRAEREKMKVSASDVSYLRHNTNYMKDSDVLNHAEVPDYDEVWHKRDLEIVDMMYHTNCDYEECNCRRGREAARANLRDSAALRTCFRYRNFVPNADFSSLKKGQLTPAHITESGVVQMLGFTDAPHMRMTLETISLCCRRHVRAASGDSALWDSIDLRTAVSSDPVWMFMPEVRVALSVLKRYFPVYFQK